MTTDPGTLRFHWGASGAGAGAAPDLAALIELCRTVEDRGMDALVLPTGSGAIDPVTMAIGLGLETGRPRSSASSRC